MLFPDKFANYPRTPILQMIYEGLVLEHQCAFLKTPCFTEHLQWLLKVGFHPASLLKKRLRQRFSSMNFAKFLRTFFLLTEDLRMTPRQQNYVIKTLELRKPSRNDYVFFCFHQHGFITQFSNVTLLRNSNAIFVT